MVDEILAAGFRGIELSYDLRRDLVEGVEARVREGAVEVYSVHAFCPVPVGVSRGHPELWLLGAEEAEVRQQAVRHLTETIRFAGSMGAGSVVVHAGYVRTWHRTAALISLAAAGRQHGRLWQWRWNGLARGRERKAGRCLDQIRDGLSQLDGVLAECRVRLAMENLPSWEAVPSELEADALLRDLPPERYGYWHDFGHGQIRENLGFINHLRLLQRLRSRVAGFHVHDVHPPATDHVLPPHGMIVFEDFAEFAGLPVPFIIEPPRDAPAEGLREAVRAVERAWRVGGAVAPQEVP